MKNETGERTIGCLIFLIPLLIIIAAIYVWILAAYGVSADVRTLHK